MLVIPHSHSFFVCWWWINLTQWTKFHLEILRETQDLFCGLYIQQISATFLFYLKLFWFLLDFEKIYRVIHLPNICSIKFRSKHSANTILCLLRNLMEQTLHILDLKKLQKQVRKTVCFKNCTVRISRFGNKIQLLSMY